MAGNNKKKRPSNYFVNNIERIGENFLDYKNSKDIYYDCPNIFRQLGKRQIELDKYGHFFFDIPFLENCIAACEQRAYFSGVSFNGMYTFCQVNYIQNRIPIPEQINNVMDTHKNSWRVYSTIAYYLRCMRQSGNIQYLYNLADMLYTNHVLRNAIQ